MCSWLRPSGFTLFEVLLALAIFVGAMAALGQLVAGGVRAAVRARLQTQAVIRCESVMGEFVAGIHPLQSTGETRFTDDTNWSWTATVLPGQYPDLYAAQVVVSHVGVNSTASVSFTLSRMIYGHHSTATTATSATGTSGSMSGSSSGSQTTGAGK